MKIVLIILLNLFLSLNIMSQDNPITLNPGGEASGDIYGIKVTEQGNNTTKLHIYRNFSYDTEDIDELVITKSGRVGIGTPYPDAQFHVYSPGGTGRGSVLSSIMIGKRNGPEIQAIQQSTDDDIQSLAFRVKSSGLASDDNFEAMRIHANGNVGIGTTIPTSKLSVKGDVHAEEVRVDLTVPGPDYVFEEEYDLPTLESIESYIQENKHLPEVPSARELKANGIDLGVMNMLLLKKVEELTLHIIAQGKEVEKLNEKVAGQQKEIELLKSKKQDL